MATGLALPSTPEPLPLGALSDPILVDPGPRLLRAVVEAYREAAPALVEPSVADLATEADETGGGDHAPPDLPTLNVFAGEAAIDAATAGFRSASRLAALLDADAVDLRVLGAPQPNPVLAGTETGFALIGNERDGPGGGTTEKATGEASRWHRVGDDASLRERYASAFAAAEPYRLRTPSRRRVYEGFAARCDESVAAAVLRALDVVMAANEGPDPEETRVRAYAVGAREGVLDRTLRRACEDAGLGSPSTFTRIKRLLREADLIETVSEPQPVGRPRERLAARGALAEAETPDETVAAVRGVTE
ncbi:transcriptional regulator TbsP domain-containing protein [Halorubrum xinjiangense]|uniref:transcriptional regulator TbsP domain-containing protein n=1 Tax=Halorubrum xinjiangense TaxID=261291 RepID=UPI003C6F8131